MIFSHVNPQPYSVMQKAGFVERVGADCFCEHIDDALACATGFITANKDDAAIK